MELEYICTICDIEKPWFKFRYPIESSYPKCLKCEADPLPINIPKPNKHESSNGLR